MFCAQPLRNLAAVLNVIIAALALAGAYFQIFGLFLLLPLFLFMYVLSKHFDEKIFLSVTAILSTILMFNSPFLSLFYLLCCFLPAYLWRASKENFRKLQKASPSLSYRQQLPFERLIGGILVSYGMTLCTALFYIPKIPVNFLLMLKHFFPQDTIPALVTLLWLNFLWVSLKIGSYLLKIGPQLHIRNWYASDTFRYIFAIFFALGTFIPSDEQILFFNLTLVLSLVFLLEGLKICTTHLDYVTGTSRKMLSWATPLALIWYWSCVILVLLGIISPLLSVKKSIKMKGKFRS